MKRFGGGGWKRNVTEVRSRREKFVAFQKEFCNLPWLISMIFSPDREFHFLPVFVPRFAGISWDRLAALRVRELIGVLRELAGCEMMR